MRELLTHTHKQQREALNATAVPEKGESGKKLAEAVEVCVPSSKYPTMQALMHQYPPDANSIDEEVWEGGRVYFKGGVLHRFACHPTSPSPSSRC